MLNALGALSASLVATSEMKVFALTESSVVTPNNLRGLKIPFFLKTSANTGTVELTGFEITSTVASGQVSAMPVASSEQIPALILNKSSLVIPGFLGTPAGMMTKFESLRAWESPVLLSSDFRWYETLVSVSM
ncbi:hypothetical protein OGATHE_005947 [Ogataea polymorpha]|uniref:Uncharacterized protein n=1 Tax=Ogataea polymorpha TaxID=460523 RepID=A0A9P8NV24_9ASCO|nr:hypothetical protein OGATHE_005947 [Ogataea polymorpha]